MRPQIIVAILMKNAVDRRSGYPTSWWDGEEEKGEGDLSMVRPIKR